MNLAKSSVKLFVSNISGALLQFLGITYFARELGAAPMGVFFLFQALLGILAIPADFGLRGAVEKRISEGKSQGIFLSTTIALKSIPIVIICILILTFQSVINNYLGSDLATLLVIAIVLQESAQLAVFVLKGELRVGETAILNVVRQAIWVVLGAVLIHYGFQADALIYSLLAGTGLMACWGWYKCSVRLKKPSIPHAQSLLDYSKFNVVSSIGGYFYSWMDVAIIGLFLTQSDVGAYETAWRVSAITILLSKAIASSIFPQVSQWDADNAIERIESVIYNAITPSIILVIPAFFGTLVLSGEILGLVFGPEFTIASGVLILLAGEKILQSVHVIFGRALQGINKPKFAAKATVIAVLLNLILNIVLIQIYGIIGAAVATTVSFSANTFLHGYYLSKFMKIKFPTRNVLWSILSSVIMAVGLVGLKDMIHVNTITELAVFIGIGSLIYTSVLLLYEPIRTKVAVMSPTNL
ncbi:oligosaccharide flippase family protein [Haloferax volcanii]|uniref:Oligosaccharide flippase family protein n=1 Tax=Haloferax volcanii TaxID=2246 RepID=A0A847TYB3_HALVO|nr:polysaccharide biosynthesis C-terminal domain-containing protein [Haloferax alexandrinus]NLV03631.1 oligosaccharide flippase family protein [Haloferax alexandrinus]